MAASAGTVRAFVAIEIPEPVRLPLAGYLAAAAPAAPDFRFVPSQNLHLTLKFLGNVPAGEIDRLAAGLALPAPGPTVALGPPGGFGGRRPRVLWLSVEQDRQELAELAAAVARAAAEIGLPSETRPFHPHVTLARSRDPRGAPVPALPRPPALPPWRADAVTIFQSRLGPGPPRYTPLHRIPFLHPA